MPKWLGVLRRTKDIRSSPYTKGLLFHCITTTKTLMGFSNTGQYQLIWTHTPYFQYFKNTTIDSRYKGVLELILVLQSVIKTHNSFENDSLIIIITIIIMYFLLSMNFCNERKILICAVCTKQKINSDV
jgi:hypothetical protein